MPAFSMIAANRPLRPCLPPVTFARERREQGRSADASVLQKLALKVSMQRNRYRLFRFARSESDNFIGPINRFPSHVGNVAKPCASIIAEKNCPAPVAVRRPHELRNLRRSTPASTGYCGRKTADPCDTSARETNINTAANFMLVAFIKINRHRKENFSRSR